MQRRFVKTLRLGEREFEAVERQLSADHHQRRTDAHPAAIVIVVRVRDGRMVVGVEDADHLAVHFDGIRDPDFAGERVDEGARGGGLAVARRSREEQAAARADDQADDFLGVIGEDQVRHRLIEGLA